VVAAAVGLGVVMAGPAPRASGQDPCSCSEPEQTTSVELQITATNPQDHSRIGPQQETLVVDLRGDQTSLVGEPPELLAGVDLSEVPVLMAVGDGGSGDDECAEERPTAGADLAVTGQVYLEETGPVVWTGLCQGTLTVEAAATGDDASADDDPWARGIALSIVVLAGLAVMCLALVLFTTPRTRDRPPPESSS